MQLQVKAIGTVHSPVTEGVDDNWGSVVSEIEVDDWLAPGLQGLEEFSHLTVVFYMHESSFSRASDLVRRPQGREDMPMLGIFCQRAKHRPNPIGITAVKLLAVEGNRLHVQGLDAIDGTPVLDIKPYFPPFDRRDDATTPEWVGRLMETYF
ncbi:MAG: tRNA (N6-threonylcarbamoyladenosine(37)-N6)-methyltransferase TrmO [Tumebacillaceae bacterium]